MKAEDAQKSAFGSKGYAIWFCILGGLGPILIINARPYGMGIFSALLLISLVAYLWNVRKVARQHKRDNMEVARSE